MVGMWRGGWLARGLNGKWRMEGMKAKKKWAGSGKKRGEARRRDEGAAVKAEGRGDAWRGVAGVVRWLGEVEAAERGMPGAGSFMARMWPMFLLAIVLGVAFDVVKWVIADARRHIYNGNRNRKYAEGGRSGDNCGCAEGKRAERKGERRNMAWRTDMPKDGRKVLLPLPSGFVEGLCGQWDKVRDSMEEVVRFGEMVIELEGYVDNSFVFGDEGEIVGRHPGIKGFLAANCPHIGYGVAIRYRLLAMKAREVARKQGKVPVQCRTIRDLEGKLDGCLGVGHRRLGRPRGRCRRPRRDCSPQGVIFSLRETARSAGRLDAPRRQRVVDALREIARELAVS